MRLPAAIGVWAAAHRRDELKRLGRTILEFDGAPAAGKLAHGGIPKTIFPPPNVPETFAFANNALAMIAGA